VFDPVSGGENQYLAMAKQFADPSWIPSSFSLTEFPGTRALFQLLVGWPLKFMEIKTAAVLFRTVNFVLLAWPLYRIFKGLRLGFLSSLLALQVFLTGQSQLGKEWMIGTFEPKTLAYVFFLWAFLFWTKNKFYRMVFCGVVACYFHIIVGGWFFIGVGLISLWNGTWKSLVKPAILALILLSPFIWYLAPLLMSAESSTSPTADHIYAYVRLMHHLGIAKSWAYFCKFHLTGAAITMALFALSFVFQRFIIKPITIWIRLGFGICLVFVIIAFVDSFLLEKQASMGLKYYPFRLNSFAYLLVLLAVFSWLGNWLFSISTKFKWVFLAVTLALASGKAIESVKKTAKLENSFNDSLITWIKENTNQTDVFLLDLKDYNGKFYQNFTRLSGRENFSVYKFIPAESSKILEWHRRQDVLRLSEKLYSSSRHPAVYIDSKGFSLYKITYN